MPWQMELYGEAFVLEMRVFGGYKLPKVVEALKASLRTVDPDSPWMWLG